LSDRWLLIKRSLSTFWSTFRRNRMGMIGAFLVVTALLAAILAPG
jgi:ABC-type antimicrobial peptide transport system permease subunit